MEVQKAIEIFLEKNNLNKTLQSFKRESKRSNIVTSHSANKKVNTQLIGMQKFTLNRTNANEIREYFQTTDEKTLKKTINKMKRNKNNLLNQKAHCDI